MNTAALKAAERAFLTRYPGGFAHPEMVEIGKKHKVDQISKFARESFRKAEFDDPENLVASLTKLVGRASVVSMFEKAKFRDYAKSLGTKEKERVSEALYELLHGKEKAGFESLLGQLVTHKLAKWPLATVVQAYYRPTKDVFVKPTTAKLIVKTLELDIEYKPAPTWDFYRRFRAHVKTMRSKTNKNLSPNNLAYCGFLMVSLGGKLD